MPLAVFRPELSCHRKLQEILEAYFRVAGIEGECKSPLVRCTTT
jgi:hypothetical protein